ncbi:MAG: MFS transporter [Dehalococcoidia bacterium]|nr:MFS transporter [Dehalococcoidia bacterium]
MAQAEKTAKGSILGTNRNVFFLGIVSGLTDISSEMVVSILPLFLSNVLGVKTSVIGLIEGIADSTATLTRLPSGWLSDRLGARKLLTLVGYGLSALNKPSLALASTWPAVLVLRFVDRVGKGVRTSPRDALIADSSVAGQQGKSFGIHRAMDTAGAMVGVLASALIIFLMQQGALDLRDDTFRTVVLISAIPAILGVFILWRFVREIKPAPAAISSATAVPTAPVRFSLRFKLLLCIMVLFTLGNSSDAFLVLRAQNVGLSVVQLMVLLGGFNLVYALAAIPFGRLSDKIGKTRVIVGGLVVFALVYSGFAGASAVWHVVLLYVGYGLYYAATEGIGKALIADIAPEARRGTAYGLYNTALGITALPASLIAGVLWQLYGPPAPFIFGAALAGAAAVLLVVLLRGERVAVRT